ncbi:MAG TPA: SHOCT domain-containing protein [Burkholderiaceae bacterium]|jgi:hypothetical protein
MKRKLVVFLTVFFITHESQAIIIIPIPNLGFPSALGKIRDALEKSTDTKALATVGEDKTFGSKYWVWGQTAGKMTQADADADAMRKCEDALEKVKNQTVGGQRLYDFGTKHCELYKFANVTLNLPSPVAPPTSVPAPVVPQTVAPIVVPTPTDSLAPVAPAVASAAAEPGPMQPPLGKENAPKAASDVVQKMRDLDVLYKQNLITKDEYEKKKKQILDAM